MTISDVTVDSVPTEYGVSSLSSMSIAIDDELYDYTASVSIDDSFSSVTGIVDDYYGRVLLARSAADFVAAQ